MIKKRHTVKEHADSQREYHTSKSITHVRKQVWVPRDRVTEWEAMVKRFRKKWG